MSITPFFYPTFLYRVPFRRKPYSMRTLFTIVFLLTISISYSQQVDAGNGHAIILDEHGDVWTIGRNYFGALGVGKRKNATSPVKIKSLPKIKEIARGYDHCIAIDVNGDLWSWGRNNYGQVGSRFPKDYFEPLKLEGHTDFIAIEGGWCHTVALKKNGSVWAWGHNTFGELGDLAHDHTNKPHSVLLKNGKPLMDIIKIASVGTHTLALTSKGELYSWGGNILGQLGHTKSKGNQRFAAKIEDLSNIESIATGWHHSVALDCNGVLYLWGSDPSTSYDGHPGETFDGIEKIEDLPKMKTIACGSWHTLSTDYNGNVWGWGKNTYGIMVTGDTISYSYPKKINGYSDICTIGGGCFQSLAVDNNGQIWTSGGNNNGQQGTGAFSAIYKPIKLELKEEKAISAPVAEAGFNFDWKRGLFIASILINLVFVLRLIFRKKSEA